MALTITVVDNVTSVEVVEEVITITEATSGPQGPTGATGATGATGPQGPSGVVSVNAGELTNSGTSSAAVLGLNNAGTPGTYTKVTTDSKGRVTSGTTLSLTDIPSGVALTTSLNLFSGGQTITQQNDSILGLSIVRNSASGNYMQTWGGTSTISSVFANGSLGVVTSGAGYNASSFSVGSLGASIPLVVIRGATSQTADMQRWQTWDGTTSTTVAKVDASGNMTAVSFAGSGTSLTGVAQLGSANAFTVGGHTITNATTTVIPLYIRGAASQTADLQQWQNSAGTVLARVQSNGVIAGAIGGSRGVLYNSPDAVTAFKLGDTSGPTIVPLTIWGAASQTAALQTFASSAGIILGGHNANGQIYSATAPITSGVGGATTAASGTGTTATITTTSAHNLAVGDLVTVAGVTPTGYNGTFVVNAVTTNTISYANATTGSQTVAGTVSVPAQASVTARSAGTLGMVIRAASGQAVSLLSFQDSAGSTLARITQSGNVQASNLQSLNGLMSAGEASGGGRMILQRCTSALTNPGANFAGLYFRDGTTAGTLKLVVRAGAAGAETTILDNIPQ